MVIFGMMFVGMAIAFVSPSGEIRPQPFLALFYASLGGAIAIIIYSSYKNRKAQQQLRRERRKKYKKKFYSSRPNVPARSENCL